MLLLKDTRTGRIEKKREEGSVCMKCLGAKDWVIIDKFFTCFPLCVLKIEMQLERKGKFWLGERIEKRKKGRKKKERRRERERERERLRTNDVTRQLSLLLLVSQRGAGHLFFSGLSPEAAARWCWCFTWRSCCQFSLQFKAHAAPTVILSLYYIILFYTNVFSLPHLRYVTLLHIRRQLPLPY